MDLDCGIKAAGHGRWSKWWAEARSLANASTTMSATEAEREFPDRPGESVGVAVNEMSGGIIAEEFLPLLSSSRAYILLIDQSHKILAASQSFRDSQIPENDPVGSSFIELFEPESQSKARSLLETMAERPCLTEFTHRTLTGATRRVTYCFCRTGDFGPVRIIAVGRDQEDPSSLAEQLVRINTEIEESLHAVLPDRDDRC